MKFLILSMVYEETFSSTRSTSIDPFIYSSDVSKKAKSWGFNIATALADNNIQSDILLLNTSNWVCDHDSLDAFILALAPQLRSLAYTHVLHEVPGYLSLSTIHTLRRHAPNVLHLAHYCADLNGHNFTYLSSFDLVLSCSPQFHNHLLLNGLNSYLFYHASPLNPSSQSSIDLSHRRTAPSFFGNLSQKHHTKRRKILSDLVNSGLCIDIFSSATNASRLLSLSHRLNPTNLQITPLLQKLHPSKLIRSLQAPVFASTFYEALSDYHFTLNIHADFAGPYSANMRLFEAAACSVCLITEDSPNIHDLFTPGYDILTYSDTDQLHSHILRCESDPDYASLIGSRAFLTARAKHTYSNRIFSLLEYLSY